MRDILNGLFNYVDGKLFWKQLNEKGFNRGGSEAGTVNKGRVFIRSRKLPVNNYSRSRIVWTMHNGDVPSGLVVDHINRNTMDDRLENLRLLTISQNCANTKGKSTKTSNLPKGVYNCSAEGKYRFQAVRNGETFSLINTSLDNAKKAAFEFFERESLYTEDE